METTLKEQLLMSLPDFPNFVGSEA